MRIAIKLLGPKGRWVPRVAQAPRASLVPKELQALLEQTDLTARTVRLTIV